jgi:Ca2+/Na+ antiporter
MVLTLLGIKLWKGATLPVLIFIVLAAFIYQILVLSLLDYIGRAEKRAQLNEMIMRTYLIVAVGTIASMGILRFFSDSFIAYVMLTLICCVVSFSAVRKRVDVYV